MSMWNRKLKARIKELEGRIEAIENPYIYKRWQKVGGFRDYMGNLYFKGDFVITDRRRHKYSLIGKIHNEYNVLDLKKRESIWLTEHRILTKKPKKNEHT